MTRNCAEIEFRRRRARTSCGRRARQIPGRPPPGTRSRPTEGRDGIIRSWYANSTCRMSRMDASRRLQPKLPVSRDRRGRLTSPDGRNRDVRLEGRRGVVEVHSDEHRAREPVFVGSVRLQRHRLRARPALDVQELQGQGEHADSVGLGHGDGADETRREEKLGGETSASAIDRGGDREGGRERARNRREGRGGGSIRVAADDQSRRARRELSAWRRGRARGTGATSTRIPRKKRPRESRRLQTRRGLTNPAFRLP